MSGLSRSLRKCVRLFVAGDREVGLAPAEIRDRMRLALRRAIYDPGPHVVGVEDVEGEPAQVVEAPGTFRYVLDHHGVDRGDLHSQEKVWVMVERLLDEAIGDPGCVFDPDDDGRMP